MFLLPADVVFCNMDKQNEYGHKHNDNSPDKESVFPMDIIFVDIF